MNKIEYRIPGMSIAVQKMGLMIKFYSGVFDIYFEETEMNGYKLYSGKWGGMNLLLCPAELANNTATQNKHQFEIIVDDIKKAIENIRECNGEIMSEIMESDESFDVWVFDPDKNSMVFKEFKKKE